jgi:hypothetical protein
MKIIEFVLLLVLGIAALQPRKPSLKTCSARRRGPAIEARHVTNGGYGGVQYTLRYGVPIVATGGKEDKPEVGARVAWSGVGRRIRTERPTPRALRRDILAVLDQP